MNKKLKPCIFCSDPAATTETFVRRHITMLNDGDTLVLGEAPSDSQSPQIVDRSIFAHYLPRLSLHKKRRRVCRLLAGQRSTAEPARLFWRMAVHDELLFGDVDYNLFEFGYILVRNWDYAVFSGKPFFVYFRGIDATRLLRQDKYVQSLARLLPMASGVVFVAPALRRELESKGLEVDNSAIIPSGVDTGFFTPGAKNINEIVSVGRFTEKKAHRDTIRSFAAIASIRPEVKLTLVGDGPLRPACEDLARDLGVDTKIDFRGELSHREVRDMLRTAAFYLQSSKTAIDGDSEGFPSAIQEALASGCVVASTRHSGANDFLEHQSNALLSEEGGYDEMANNVIDAIEDESLRSKLSHRARSLAVSDFDARISVSRFESFVQSSLGHGR